MHQVYDKSATRGGETDKHQFVRVNLSDIEVAMFNKLKGHYKFKTDRELVIALIKRAHMNL